ncbi:unannotated protein [freshwater metagenome]|uniref:Unannotated protein n=1 Tax=freshwater metagenome TaxID=449393 RepID=A0A6J7HX88_9ZZZZ|nr:S8 family serine peptidase [Actinomycetota bacterium]
MINLRPLLLIPALAAVLCAAAAAPALALDAVPGEVVVQYEPGSPAQAAAAAGAAPQVLRVKDVPAAIERLRRHPGVRYAVPNVRARVAQSGAGATFVPNDPGDTGTAGGWQALQWNFAGEFGVHAPEAWANAIAAGAPGGRGVTIAVLDTGVAYRTRSPYRISPDFRPPQFVRGYDFVDRDRFPFDRNGHGTHVAATIAEATNNGVALTGLAYGARIMAVRVLDSVGEGNATDIARGVRYAARHGAKVINLSLEFDADVRARDIPQLLQAIAYARSRGALVVGAAGNEGRGSIAYPARAYGVTSVGATTEHGCVSEFSNFGRGLDLVAPGGGADTALADDPNCGATESNGRNIVQLTFSGRSATKFGMPTTYEGTSMAVPHVSATAALVLATGVLGRNPSPATLEKHLKRTARDLGPAGPDSRYGSGLVDAAAATAPGGGGIVG